MKALTDYVSNGGNLLWLSEPTNDDLHLALLADALGIRVLPGVLVDGQGAALGLKDPRMLALGDYPQHAITRGFQLTTLFPQVSALAMGARTDWKVAPFLRSSAQSWTEFKAIDNAQASTIQYDASAGELKGPLDFGFALSRLSPSPDKAEQRVVAFAELGMEAIYEFDVKDMPVTVAVDSFGAGYSPTEDLTLDLAVSYLKEEDVNVNRTKKNQ